MDTKIKYIYLRVQKGYAAAIMYFDRKAKLDLISGETVNEVEHMLAKQQKRNRPMPEPEPKEPKKK